MRNKRKIMKLRKLELIDASLMIEWMHDKTVVENLRTDFMSKTLWDCEKFIKGSWNDKSNLNLAIADENDEYMGTVSLKNIEQKSAEFGITVRVCAMGKGYSIWAMKEMLRIAFEERKLEVVYWCVSPINERAVQFYDKNDFCRIEANNLNCIKGYTEEQIKQYIWYAEKRT